MIEHLRRRYSPENGWQFFEEVCWGTGKHRADGIALGLWESRGLALLGFEIKTARSDWLRELANPEKAESFWQECDEWYLVVPGYEVARLEECPPTWGMMIVKAGKLAIVKKPPRRPSRSTISRKVAVNLIEKAVKPFNLDLARHDREIQEKAMDFCREQNKAANDRLQEKLAEVAKRISDFEAASGIDIGSRNPARVGRAVNRLLYEEGPVVTRLAADIERALAGVESEIAEAREIIKALRTEPEKKQEVDDGDDRGS